VEGPALPQLLLPWVMPWQQGITPQTSGSPLGSQDVMPCCQGITLHMSNKHGFVEVS